MDTRSKTSGRSRVNSGVPPRDRTLEERTEEATPGMATASTKDISQPKTARRMGIEHLRMEARDSTLGRVPVTTHDQAQPAAAVAGKTAIAHQNAETNPAAATAAKMDSVEPVSVVPNASKLCYGVSEREQIYEHGCGQPAPAIAINTSLTGGMAPSSGSKAENKASSHVLAPADMETEPPSSTHNSCEDVQPQRCDTDGSLKRPPKQMCRQPNHEYLGPRHVCSKECFDSCGFCTDSHNKVRTAPQSFSQRPNPTGHEASIKRSCDRGADGEL